MFRLKCVLCWLICLNFSKLQHYPPSFAVFRRLSSTFVVFCRLSPSFAVFWVFEWTRRNRCWWRSSPDQSILTLTLERKIVKPTSPQEPTKQHPPNLLDFTDQFAFRPLGSTTASLTVLLQTISTMLSNNKYVIVSRVSRNTAPRHCAHRAEIHACILTE